MVCKIRPQNVQSQPDNVNGDCCLNRAIMKRVPVRDIVMAASGAVIDKGAVSDFIFGSANARGFRKK